MGMDTGAVLAKAKSLVDILHRITLAEKEQEFREVFLELRDACLAEREQRQNLKEECLKLREELEKALAENKQLKSTDASAYHVEQGLAWKKGPNGRPHGHAFCANCVRKGEDVYLAYTDARRRHIRCPNCKAEYQTGIGGSLEKHIHHSG